MDDKGPRSAPLLRSGRRPALSVIRRLGPGAKVSFVIFGLLWLPLLAPGVLAPYDPALISPAEIFQPPSRAHLLGTDQYGRDLLSRVIYGTRTSMSLGLVSV